MGTCEMCGEQGDTKKTKVEGAKLDLCEDCQEVGEVIETSTSSTAATQRSSKTSSRSRSRTPSGDDKDLAPDFDDRVKQAREDKDMSVTKLAERLKEKKSVVQRIEAGSLTPDRKLAKKLERILGITLYEDLGSVSAETDTDSGQTEQTIGDVAEVKERD